MTDPLGSPSAAPRPAFGAFLSMHPPEEQFALAQRCEALGLDSLWTGDHVAFHNPLYDALTLLASYAGITKRIKLGSGVYLLALRRPTVVAKITSTLDVLCGGRLIFELPDGDHAVMLADLRAAHEGFFPALMGDSLPA